MYCSKFIASVRNVSCDRGNRDGGGIGKEFVFVAGLERGPQTNRRSPPSAPAAQFLTPYLVPVLNGNGLYTVIKFDKSGIPLLGLYIDSRFEIRDSNFAEYPRQEGKK